MVISWLKKPDDPDTPNMDGQAEQNAKGVLVNKTSSNASLPIIYGKRKVGGVAVFMETSGTDNTYLYMIMALCEGGVESCEKIYIDDKLVTWSGALGDGTERTVNSSDSNFYKADPTVDGASAESTISVTWYDEYNYGWNAEPTQDTVFVASGTQKIVSFTFQAPVRFVVDDDEMDYTVTASSENSTTVGSDITQTLKIDNIYGVDIYMKQGDAKEANRGESVSYTVEIKNIGSFHDLEKALHFEITRQQSLFERDIEIVQETRHWDDGRKITVSARTKEEEAEYRYHLEADIPWVRINDNTKNQLRAQMPESISSKKERYISKYDITPQVAGILASDRYFSELFEKANNETNAKDVANMITTDIMGLLDTREKREISKLEAGHLSDLAECVKSNKITRASAKLALDEIIKNGKPLSQIIEVLDLGHVSDESTLSDIISQVLNEEVKAAEDAKQNPETVNFLVGKVMQKTHGKADPELTLTLLKKNLDIE